jgi:hypothetical protein
MEDDFDKRDFLSPLRIAIQEGKKAKEMDNDAQKASQQRNNEAMWSQVDSFIIGLCELFDIPGQIEKAIRQFPGASQYRFSLSVSSFYDYQQYIESALLEGNRHVGRITTKLSEVLPNMDNKLLMDWVERLYSIPNYPGKSWNSLEMSSRPLSLSPSQHQRVHKRILTAPEQGSSAFFAHMKRHFFYLLREGFLRDGIDLQGGESSIEKIYMNDDKEIECGTVGDYIGSECKSSQECTGLCDSPARCNWAFNKACSNCTADDWRYYKDDCTERVENLYVYAKTLSFVFRISPE